MLIKIDIAKTYDTLSWNVVLDNLSIMGFPPNWISWVMTCLSSARFSLLINGQPSIWFFFFSWDPTG